ncbi:hypothetical protein VCR5J5_340017 [Vibrio crassostreae]|uniref:Uncharacterized protein n=1 Tax=Vibrio crassostreae TaxID=246167 RepID=A0A822N212_9VIBR|nr:hypothetical protein VCR5J5_340017 [Vibrio crassostreae]
MVALQIQQSRSILATALLYVIIERYFKYQLAPRITFLMTENEKGFSFLRSLFLYMVGEEGFEPPTLWSQTRCATKLRYSPRYLTGSLPVDGAYNTDSEFIRKRFFSYLL